MLLDVYYFLIINILILAHHKSNGKKTDTFKQSNMFQILKIKPRGYNIYFTHLFPQP